MKNGICYIVGAGEDCRIDFIPTTDDFVIAADAGLRYLEQAEINTDLVIGDFDTLNAIPQHPNVISLSTEKMIQICLPLSVRESMRAIQIFTFTAELAGA